MCFHSLWMKGFQYKKSSMRLGVTSFQFNTTRLIQGFGSCFWGVKWFNGSRLQDVIEFIAFPSWQHTSLCRRHESLGVRFRLHIGMPFLLVCVRNHMDFLYMQLPPRVVCGAGLLIAPEVSKRLRLGRCKQKIVYLSYILLFLM